MRGEACLFEGKCRSDGNEGEGGGMEARRGGQGRARVQAGRSGDVTWSNCPPSVPRGYSTLDNTFPPYASSQGTCLLILQVLEEWRPHQVSVRSGLRLSKPFYLPQIDPNSSQFLYSKSITTFCKSEINTRHYPEQTLSVLHTLQHRPWHNWRAIGKQIREKTWRSRFPSQSKPYSYLIPTSDMVQISSRPSSPLRIPFSVAHISSSSLMIASTVSDIFVTSETSRLKPPSSQETTLQQPSRGP